MNPKNILHFPPQTREDWCDTHGAYEAKCFIGTHWSPCPLCHADTEAQEQAAEVRERKQQAWQQKIRESGIPLRFQTRPLDTYRPTTPKQAQALCFAKAYAEGFDTVLQCGRSAIFLGKPGTGKTHLSCGIGLSVMRDYQRSVRFISVIRAMRRIKETWHKDSQETESQAIEALVFPDLLILDEVGQQFGSDTEKLILFDALNERYEKLKPTLLLSNLLLNDYEEKGQKKPGIRSFLGERIFDRLRENGGKYLILDGESGRGKTAGGGMNRLPAVSTTGVRQ